VTAARAAEPIAADDVLEALAEPTIVLDDAGRPLRSNAAARTLIGRALLRRATLLDEVVPEELARAALRRALREHDEATIETSLRNWRGEEVEIELSVRPLPRRADAHALLILRDLHRARAAAKPRAAGQRRFEALVSALEVGVLVEDEQRRIVLANDAFCRLFGVQSGPSVLVGIDCAHASRAAAALFVEPDEYLAGEARCIERGARGVATRGERLRLSDGRVYERDYAPIPPTGQVGHLWIYRDVTEQHVQERALREAKEEAEAASAAKDSFCAILSHELRTPMGAVLGLTELLLSSELSQPQREAASGVDRAGRSLLALVDDLLDYGKIRAGKFVVQAVDADPRRALREAVEVLRPQADAKGLSLSLRFDAAVPAWAHVDAVRLRQIVSNLVSNAIKYTRAGEVEVEARFDAASRRLDVRVHDSGTGVPEGAEPLLFQPFSRVPDPSHARVLGTGLGLVISRQLVEVMGGAIGYQRREGGGSTFWFHVLLGPSQSSPRPTSVHEMPVFRPRVGGVRERRGVVLLAEDEPLNRMVAARMIEELGFEVVSAGDGMAAVETARTRRFDVIFMDLEMPMLDGLSATRQIREAQRGAAPTPIVAVTANAMRGDRERCLSAGMDDYLAKPITLADLAAVLDRQTDGRAMASDPPIPKPAPIPRVRERLPTLDRARVTGLAGPEGDPALISELIAIFRRDAQHRVRALESAADRSALEEVQKQAHALKGASATFGAPRLASCASTLESAAKGRALDGLRDQVRALEGELAAVERAPGAGGMLACGEGE
jgi:signal transduction histidine kinase/CheY-like chemotaxis protein/HPt (histidine-containing phosphotransfer) domain-containing protein